MNYNINKITNGFILECGKYGTPTFYKNIKDVISALKKYEGIGAFDSVPQPTEQQATDDMVKVYENKEQA